MEPTPAAAGSYRTKLWITVAVIARLVLVNKWMAGELGQITRPLGHPKVQLFTIMLLAILLEGFPFLLAGSFVSGALEVLVPPAFLEERVFPRQKLPAAAVGSLLGLIFPVCSCGNIPVARRLLHKGVPVAGVVAYLLAAPIINPVTLFSTAMAFPAERSVLFGRMSLAFCLAVLAGLFLGAWEVADISRESAGEHHCHQATVSAGTRWAHIVDHAEHDFFLTGRYLILGASIAALFQTLLPRSAVNALATNPLASIVLLQFLGMAFSLCSFADAFVASTFTGLPAAAKITFLLAGPTTSVSLIILYWGGFKKGFASRLIVLAVTGVFVLTSLAALAGRWR